MKHALLLMSTGLLLLAGCGGIAPPTDASANLELRVYQVPPENTGRYAAALSDVLNMGDKDRLGTVASPGSGQLLVLAPAKLHDTIGETLKSLNAPNTSGGAAAPDRRYELQFWAVDVIPGPGADDPATAGIATALTPLRQQFADVHFALRDKAMAISDVGSSVEKSWIDADERTPQPESKSLKYTLVRSQERLRLDIQYSDQILYRSQPGIDAAKSPSAVSSHTAISKTTVAVILGQWLVLSQNPVPVVPADPKNVFAKTLRVYIIRCDPVPVS